MAEEINPVDTSAQRQTAAGTSLDAPEPVNGGGFTLADVQRLIAENNAELEKRHQAEIRRLKRENAEEAAAAARAVRGPDSKVPGDGAGPGLDVHQTWGQWHQELLRAGLFTDEHHRATAGLEPLSAEEDDDA